MTLMLWLKDAQRKGHQAFMKMNKLWLMAKTYNLYYLLKKYPVL